LAIDAAGMESLYTTLTQSIRGHGMPIEAVAFIEMMEQHNFDPHRIKGKMSANIDLLTEEWEHPVGGWKNARSGKELIVREAMFKVLFCPLEEVPLHINGQFADIAKWRLENAQ